MEKELMLRIQFCDLKRELFPHELMHLSNCSHLKKRKKLSSSHNSACTIKKQSTMDHVMKSDKNKIYNLK